jgi:hypothetical protein
VQPSPAIMCREIVSGDVAVTDHPSDVGRGPPHIALAQAEDPISHGVDVDLVAAVRMDRQLRPGRGARGGQDERRLVGLQPLDLSAVAARASQELLPGHVTAGPHRRLAPAAAQHYHVPDAPAVRDRLVHDRFQRHLAALAPGEVGTEHRRGPGQPQPLFQRSRAEPGEHHQVNGADPGAGQHHDDRFRAGRHVDPDPVPSADAQAPQRRRRPAHLLLQLPVGQRHPAAALVLTDQRRDIAPALLHVPVHGIPGDVGQPAGIPAEVPAALIGPVRVPVGHRIPSSPPRQRRARRRPKRLRVSQRLTPHRLDLRTCDPHPAHLQQG